MIIRTLANTGWVIQDMGSDIKCRFMSMILTKPSVANKLLNIMEYATREVTQGRKIAVLKKPLPFNFLSLSIDEITRARIIITGT